MFLATFYRRGLSCRVPVELQVYLIERMQRIAFILRIPTRHICSRMQSTRFEYMDCSLIISWVALQAYINHHPDLFNTFVNLAAPRPSYLVQ